MVQTDTSAEIPASVLRRLAVNDPNCTLKRFIVRTRFLSSRWDCFRGLPGLCFLLSLTMYFVDVLIHVTVDSCTGILWEAFHHFFTSQAFILMKVSHLNRCIVGNVHSFFHVYIIF